MKLITYQAQTFVQQLRLNQTHKVWTDFYKIFNDWSIGINDRTGTFDFPIKTIIPDNMKIPVFQNTTVSYRDCCINQALKILEKQESCDLPVYLMYSGGIDSTAVLSAFIDLLGVEKAAHRITLKMSKESIDENPFFWYKFIRKHFNVEESNFGYNEFDFGNAIYITGELNDQLFGSDIQQHFVLFGGDNFLNSNVSVGLLANFFEKFKGISKEGAEFWAQLFFENLNSCPKHTNTLWDVLWWYNFCWKWIYVYYRVFLFSKIEGPINKVWLDNNYFPFFSDKSFQLWSMNNLEPKNLGTWDTYKFTAKKYITEVSGCNEYMKKVKRQSLQNIVNMRPRNHSLTETYEIIDNKKINLETILQNPKYEKKL